MGSITSGIDNNYLYEIYEHRWLEFDGIVSDGWTNFSDLCLYM